MTTTALTKQQILDQARQDGIELSYEMLGKYVRYGLLKSEKNELGGRKVVYKDALANIRLVRKYNAAPYFFHLKDTLFLLYWKGQPIRTRTLLDHMQDYQAELKKEFQNAVKDTENPALLETYYASLIRKELIPVYSSGRDGRMRKETERELEESTKKFAADQSQFRQLLAAIELAGGITFDVLKGFIPEANPMQEELQTLLKRHTAFRTETWMNSSLFTNEDDEQLLEALVKLLREYWTTLTSSPIAQTEIVQSLAIFLDMPLFQVTPQKCKALLYWILASGIAADIVTWLSNPDIKQGWYEIWHKADWSNFKTLQQGGDFHV